MRDTNKLVEVHADRRNFIKGAAAASFVSAVGISPVANLPAEAERQRTVAAGQPWHFRLEEATIADVHRAFLEKQLTAVQLVNLYLERIAAYNGVCVKGAVDPKTGLQLGDIAPIENAGQTHALITLNVRGKRSKTDTVDNDPDLPDAIETARALDAQLAKSGKLIGPLHGIPMAVKDLFDTRDMRTTNGAEARYGNDRPPHDCTVVARLQAAGAIILAKANEGDYANGDRSTYGGTACNVYDTTRSAGRSSGGPAAATAANLVMCALGEETGQSVRNPAANENLVGIVPTFGLVSRVGMMPWSLAQDRAGVLSRTVEDGAIVLNVIAGIDPKDPATAMSYGQTPSESYASFAQKPSLKGVRLGLAREFMQRINEADDDSLRLTNDAIAELRRLGATIVDPGPDGQLFGEALAGIISTLDGKSLVASFPDYFAQGDPMQKLVDISLGKSSLPPDASMRWYLGNGFPDDPSNTAQTKFLMNRYYEQRGDRVIKDVKTLAANSTSYYTAPIDHVPSDTQGKLEGLSIRKETLWTEDGKPFTHDVPMGLPDMGGFYGSRAVLNALVLKVMADHQLDAFVYPMKTLPAAIIASPLEPENLKTMTETSIMMIDGVKYIRKRERVIAERNPLGTELSTNAGLPAVVVPIGFTKEVYDREAVVGKDGSKKAGKLVGPKADALSVGLEFMGRQFSEPMLIRIAAAYEASTHFRSAPKSFGPLARETEKA